MKLYCKHPEWIEATKQLYNEVEEFYYRLLLNYPEHWGKTAQSILRELEKLTVKSRSGEEPAVTVPFERVPVYFRRAAINAAIAMLHSYHTKLKNWEQKKAEAEQEGFVYKKTKPETAKSFCASPTFYKGMYKEFEEGSIVLKLYTGSSWSWVKCKLRGRAVPKEGEKLSPTVVTGKKEIRLHIPVKMPVEDGRSVKERMEAGEAVCGITFTNSDAFAVCVIYAADGRAAASRFIRGGKEFAHHSKRLLEKVGRNRSVMGKHFDWTGANKRHWEHLKHLRDYHAHRVSREIVRFCQAYNVKIIVYTKTEGMSGMTAKQRLSYEAVQRHVMSRTGKYSPYGLSSLIKKQLSYKAWQEGIVITGVRPHYTAEKCTVCRSYLLKGKDLRKNGTGAGAEERSYCCPNGHKGNKDLNTAKNIAKAGLKKFGRPAA